MEGKSDEVNENDGEEEDKQETSNPIVNIRFPDLISRSAVDNIYADMGRDYYWSKDWSPEMYALQAVRGFIAVGYTSGIDHLLLPQIQRSYCILNFDRLEPNSRVVKRLKKYQKKLRLCINKNFCEILEAVHLYHGEDSWLSLPYRAVCEELYRRGDMYVEVDGKTVVFRMCSVGLYAEEELVAGELGYAIGGVFTSLTGFTNTTLTPSLSIGLIQILSLIKVLEVSGFSFLNLGHPPSSTAMRYKQQIGGEIVDRSDFITLWEASIYPASPPVNPCAFSYDCDDVAALFKTA